MPSIFDSLEGNAPYHVSIAARVPVQELVKAATKEELDSWNDHLYVCRKWLEKPPSRMELSAAMLVLLMALYGLKIPEIEALTALMEGRNFDADAPTLRIIHAICPFSLEPDGEHTLKADVPAEFLEIWANDPESGTANLANRFRLVDPAVALLGGLAALYGAIPLDEALGILRNLGALDGLDGNEWIEDAKRRLHATTAYRTRIVDGLLFTHLEEGDAKWLVREVQAIPRWIPKSKEDLLAWISNGCLDDTPATAALTTWAFEHAAIADAGLLNAIIAGTAARVRGCLLKITEEIPLFASDGEDWSDEDGGDEPDTYDLDCLELGLFDCDLPLVLRTQFTIEQRRWILKGATTLEFSNWLSTPEGVAWREAQAAKPARGKKSNKKKHRRR